MLTTLLALLVLSAVAVYFMTPEERERLARAALVLLGHAVRAIGERSPSGDPFDVFLRTRTGWPVVTLTIIGLNTFIFIVMLVGGGAVDDVTTLIAWGGNSAPRTTGGEWWRLVTSMFVHGGVLHLLATVAALVPLGFILERALGPFAFATLYLASGILAGVVSLWTMPPMGVGIGASGAIFGIYGVLLASIAWILVTPLPARVPFITVKRLGAAAAVFLLYNLFTDRLDAASEMAGLCTGMAGGLIVARGVARERPAVPRAAVAMAATLLIAIASAVPLRGIVDVRPEIARIAAAEERTSGAYDEAVEKFRRRRLNAAGLVVLIDQTILPELQALRARLRELRDGVPPEQQAQVAAAEKYFALREKSWRRRAEGLLKSRTEMLREAELAERAALEALRRMQAFNEG